MAQKYILGVSGLPKAADNPTVDFHETEDAMLEVYTLGRISVGWNFCEHYFSTLVWNYFDDFEKGIAVTASLGNQSRADLLLTLVRKYERSKRVIERVEFAAKAFNRLRDTRNILLHAHSINPHESGKLAFTRAAARPGHIHTLANLDDLNRVYEDMVKLSDFMMHVGLYVMASQHPGVPRCALPKIYSLPEMLIQLRPEVPKASKPRRRSSQA
jgi:hypothetical protein